MLNDIGWPYIGGVFGRDSHEKGPTSNGVKPAWSLNKSLSVLWALLASSAYSLALPVARSRALIIFQEFSTSARTSSNFGTYDGSSLVPPPEEFRLAIQRRGHVGAVRFVGQIVSELDEGMQGTAAVHNLARLAELGLTDFFGRQHRRGMKLEAELLAGLLEMGGAGGASPLTLAIRHLPSCRS